MKRLALLLGLMAALATRAPAESFSLDPASPSIGGSITPDDVLAPGPAVLVPGSSLGLQDNFPGGVFDNLDGLSNGRDPITGPLLFSVDRVAVGLPGTAVFDQASPAVASAAGDTFRAISPGGNVLDIAEARRGLVPGFFGDDLDALDLDHRPGDPLYFSIDDLSASIGPGIRPGDIFLNSINTLFASFSSLGLDPGDDLDALVLDAANRIVLFSLSPFSPSTFTTSGAAYAPGVKGQLSPSDILISRLDGSFALHAPASSLGLRPDDNVDALETIPEPSALALATTAVVAGAVAAGWRRRAAVVAIAAGPRPR